MTLLQNQPDVDPMLLEEGITPYEIADEEIGRLKSYAEIYRQTHPFPKEPSKAELSFWKMIGGEAIWFYMAAIGGVAVAAIRTGGMFMITEVMLLKQYNTNILVGVLPTITLIFSLFAFEGYLFAIGKRRGKASGRLNTSPWGTGAAFLVSVLAGLVSSFPLINVSMDSGIGLTFTWILVAAMAISAPALALLGSENIGVLENIHEAKVKEIHSTWREESKIWYEYMQRDYRNKGRTRIYGLEKYNSASLAKVAKSAKGTGIGVNKVREYMSARNLSASDVGPASKGFSFTPDMIAEELGLNTESERSGLRVILSRMRKAE
jgi:hypothetical protein